MREIKFRAWDGHRWVIPATSVNGDNHTLTVRGLNDRDAIMQYTGLKDKNGVEIYEGDICLYDGLPGAKNGLPIVWANGGFFLQGRLGTDTKILSQTTPSRDLEVIGNIYETPALLTGAKGAENE